MAHSPDLVEEKKGIILHVPFIQAGGNKKTQQVLPLAWGQKGKVTLLLT